MRLQTSAAPPRQPSEGEAPYRWIVVAVSMLVGAATFGIPNSFGVLFKPVLQELGGSRTTISGAASLYIFLHGAVAILWGWCTDRYGIRVVLGAGSVLITIGVLLSSRAGEVWQFYLTYGVVFAVGVGTVYVPTMSNALTWFEKRRGFALGMVASGAGLGTIVFPPLVERLIAVHGWRTAFAVIGMLPVVVILAGLPFLRAGPRGRSPAPNPLAVRQDNPPPEVGLRQALRRRAFWIVFAMYFLSFVCLHMVYVHLVPRATDAGVASTVAAALPSAVGGFSVVGKLLGGMAVDRVGGRRAFIALMTFQSLTFLWLLLSYETWMFFLFAVAFGLAYGGWMPLIPALAAELFGARHLGAVFGGLTFGAALGGMVGPTMAGYVFDKLGSYSLAFGVGLMASALAVVLASVGLVQPRRALR